MKKLLSLCSFLFSAAVLNIAYGQALDRLLAIPQFTVESRYEYDADHNRVLNYYNNDFCDYYLYRTNDNSYKLRPGKNTVHKISGNTPDPAASPSSYYRFRGIFPKDFSIKTPYAFPTRNGAQVSWNIDRRERLKTMQFGIAPDDTVFAVRSGVACKTVDDRFLLVNHPDGTFSAYLNMPENFRHEGEKIGVGEPVGIAGPAGVSISFFFLDRNKFSYGARPLGHPYSHFIPYFRTSRGDCRPHEDTVYQCIIDDMLISMDMTRKDAKKYYKSIGKKMPEMRPEHDGEKASVSGVKFEKKRADYSLASSSMLFIRYLDDEVHPKDKEYIGKMIRFETSLFESIGLKDMQETVNLHVFEDRKRAQAFLYNSFGKDMDVRRIDGLYLPKAKTAVIIGIKDNRDRAVSVICHELSHHLLEKTVRCAPVWLNEGLAEYFEHSRVDRQENPFHYLSDYEKGRLRTGYMLEEIDLAVFINLSHKEFMDRQKTDESVSYILSHALVTYLIDYCDPSVIGSIMEILNREKLKDSPRKILDSAYPGGFETFEKDFYLFIHS